MIANISELFLVDIEQFMGALKAIYTHAGNLEAYIENGTYRNINILYELENISRLVDELRRIFTSIRIKVERYRPGNTLLYNYLKSIDGHIRRLGGILWMVVTVYQRDPNYDINNLYNALMTIREIVEEIENELNIAIEKGLFM